MATDFASHTGRLLVLIMSSLSVERLNTVSEVHVLVERYVQVLSREPVFARVMMSGRLSVCEGAVGCPIDRQAFQIVVPFLAQKKNTEYLTCLFCPALFL